MALWIRDDDEEGGENEGCVRHQESGRIDREGGSRSDDDRAEEAEAKRPWRARARKSVTAASGLLCT